LTSGWSISETTQGGRTPVADDYQFGGGGGMVLKPEPLFDAGRGAADAGVREWF
jgi:tRNA G37 N-methylase TrmD